MSVSTFLYFAYGSNLLRKRIHIQNPSAVPIGPAKLLNYRLDFNGPVGRWGGSPATIVPHIGGHVWGMLWNLRTEDMTSLDHQEGVHKDIYFPLEVVVETHEGQEIARTYQLVDVPDTFVPLDSLPPHRRPSRLYMEVILQGAIESNLHRDYIELLKRIRHNGVSFSEKVADLNSIDFIHTTDMVS